MILRILFSIAALLVPPNAFTSALVISSNGTYGEVKYWNLTDPADLNPPLTEQTLGALRFSPDGSILCLVVEAEYDGSRLWCLDVLRDETNGRIQGFVNPQMVFDREQLDVGFSAGPDGFDFYSLVGLEEIAYGTWDWSTSPPSFTEVHSFHPGNLGVSDIVPTTRDLESTNPVGGTQKSKRSNKGQNHEASKNQNARRRNANPEGTENQRSRKLSKSGNNRFQKPMGLDFSPVVPDPYSGYGMLLVGDDYDIWEMPLKKNESSGYYEPVVNETRVLCDIPQSWFGDVRFIPSGIHQHDLLTIDWSSETIDIIPLDNVTGYPIDANTSIPGVSLTNPLIIPFLDMNEDIIGVRGGPWGMVFDPNTNDFLVSIWSSRYRHPIHASLFLIRGFPPGIDVSVVGNELQTCLEEIGKILSSGGQRLLRGSAAHRNMKPKEEVCGYPDPDTYGLCNCGLCESAPGRCNKVIVASAERPDMRRCVAGSSLKNAGKKNLAGVDLPGCTCTLSECTFITKEEDLTLLDESLLPTFSVDDAVDQLLEGDASLIDDAVAALTDTNLDSFEEILTGDTLSEDFLTKLATVNAATLALQEVAGEVDPGTDLEMWLERAKTALNLLFSIGSPLEVPEIEIPPIPRSYQCRQPTGA